jgi:hypothetical protein
MHSQALATARAAGRAAAADAAAARADAQVAHSKMAARTAAAAAAQLTLSRREAAAASGRSSPVRMPHAPQSRSESPSATLGRLRAELSASLRGEAHGRVHLPWDGPSPGTASDASATVASAPRLLRVPTVPPPPPLRAPPPRAGLAAAEADAAASFAEDLARWGRPHHGGPASASSYGSSHSEGGSSRHGSTARAALQGAISDVLGSMARVRAQSPQYRAPGGARQRM